MGACPRGRRSSAVSSSRMSMRCSSVSFGRPTSTPAHIHGCRNMPPAWRAPVPRPRATGIVRARFGRSAPSALRKGCGKRVAREQRLRLALDGERARLGIATRTDAEQLEASWASISVPERRQRMSDTIDAIFVLREPDCRGNRIFVCARGEAPCDRQRRGRIGKPTMPVALAALRRASTLTLRRPILGPRAGSGKSSRSFSAHRRWTVGRQTTTLCTRVAARCSASSS